jgi:hypothetical protein
MITKKAVGLANEILQAQKKASNEKINYGVFVCIDSEKGLFDFIEPKDLIIQNTTLLLEIQLLKKQTEELKEELLIIKQELKTIEEKNINQDELLELHRNAIKEIDDKVEEEGEVL